MSEQRKGFLMLSIIFGLLMFIAGLAGIIPKGQSVIYVSKQFQLYGVSSKTLTGQLKNRTNSMFVLKH